MAFRLRPSPGTKRALFSGRNNTDPSSHHGTGVDGRRFHLMRAIGGTEGTKWKKSNEFNSSEPSSGANSLDLFQTGPLY